jgi:hypothetical protein
MAGGEFLGGAELDVAMMVAAAVTAGRMRERR